MTSIQEKMGETMAYGGSAGTVVAGLSTSEVGVIVGIVTAVIGLAVQLFFGLRRDAREQQLHALSLEKLIEEADGPDD